MLFRKHGGGDEDGDLFSASHRFERATDGNLGFSEADIAANQAVHRPGGLEVELGFLDRPALVGGLGVVK